MVARIATFEGVDITAVRTTIGTALDRLEPLFRQMPGWQGVVDVADPSSGKVISIHLFDSDENLDAAEPVFEERMPEQLGELMHFWTGRRVSVEQYEVLLAKAIVDAAESW
jgi:hypothetical protein